MEFQSNNSNKRTDDEIINDAMEVANMMGMSKSSKDFIAGDIRMCQDLIDHPENFNENMVQSIIAMLKEQ